MDAVSIFSLAVAAAAALAVTAYGLLPERIDITFVFAAYGAGSVIGGFIAARNRGDGLVYARRWGGLLMGVAALWLALGLAGVLPS